MMLSNSPSVMIAVYRRLPVSVAVASEQIWAS
jgi:hypothetical protein